MKEEWRDVEGFEECYQISAKGRVRSKDRVVKCGNGLLLRKGKVLKPQPNSIGYLRFNAKNNEKSKRIFVHRAVAIAFIPREEGRETVNHKDSNPLNNRVSNLEWLTHKENMHHAIKKGRMDKHFALTAERFRKDNELKKKPVLGTDMATGEVKYFPSVNEAGRHFEGSAAGEICVCCQGKRRMARGYLWEYANEKDRPAISMEW